MTQPERKHTVFGSLTQVGNQTFILMIISDYLTNASSVFPQLLSLLTLQSLPNLTPNTLLVSSKLPDGVSAWACVSRVPSKMPNVHMLCVIILFGLFGMSYCHNKCCIIFFERH